MSLRITPAVLAVLAMLSLGLIAGLFAAASGPFSPAEAGKMRRLLQPIPGKPQAPAFRLPDTDGTMRTLEDWAGKVLIVNFWATWCPPCRKEMPAMERAWRKVKDKGVVLLAIHVGGNEDRIWAFLTDYDITFPVLIDKTGAVSRAWRTIGLPTTVVVDPAGRMVLKAIGGREWDDPAILDAVLALRGTK